MENKLISIREEITRLGHKHLQSKVPLPLEKVQEILKPWGEAEKAITKIIIMMRVNKNR